MIKLDTPFWAGLQNFVFLPGIAEPEWTTASQTPWHKLKRLITGKPKMAHTRSSGDIPGHGQLIQLKDGKLVVGDEGLMKWTESYTLEGVPGIDDIIQQGLDQSDTHIYTVFGNASKDSIQVFKHNFDKTLVNQGSLPFELYKKWYHKSWEAEGIRVHPETGEVWIGINFKTIYGTHKNYIEQVSL